MIHGDETILSRGDPPGSQQGSPGGEVGMLHLAGGLSLDLLIVRPRRWQT